MMAYSPRKHKPRRPPTGKENYKVVVDKTVLLDFFMEPDPSKITEAHLREIDKVFNIIFAKFFSSYYHIKDDLIGYARVALLSRRSESRFDPSFGVEGAYNYIFTLFRNEIGNNCIKMVREVPSSDLRSFREEVYESHDYDEDYPEELRRYAKAMMGMVNTNFLRIPKKDALDIIIYCRTHENKPGKVKLPPYLENNKNATSILYKLLKDLQNDTDQDDQKESDF